MFVTETPIAHEFLRVAWDRITVPTLRGWREFAESEIILPDGPAKGERFQCLPFQRLFFGAIDSGAFGGFAMLGPAQATKTTIGFLVPLLWSLFEARETCVVGLPDLRLANDKWRVDILPIIESSGFADLLPKTGPGSRNGKIESTVTFRNNAVLKFMSGRGRDEARSGFTARRVFISEVDKMDESSSTSREANKVDQMLARTGAFGDDALFGLESTPSYSWGRVWREFIAGTASTMFCRCVHCREWVCPGRDQLVGWREAESEGEARERARWTCPQCRAQISEAERLAMNEGAVLVHRGQHVEGDGQIVGEPPATRTLGFRFDAFNYTTWTAQYVAGREYRAAADPDTDNGEKQIQQFTWGRYWDPPQLDANKLEWRQIARRQRDLPRGEAPAGTLAIVVGVDPGKYCLHWVARAIVDDGTAHICDYGRVDVPTDSMELLRATLSALRTLRDQLAAGFIVPGRPDRMRPVVGLVDSGDGNTCEAVYAFVRESRGWHATKGYSCTRYPAPRSGSNLQWLGTRAHAIVLEANRVLLIEFDADRWKTTTHDALCLPIGTAGAVTLFSADIKEHTHFGQHCIAETQSQEFTGGRYAVRWKPRGSTDTHATKKSNHFWDCLVLSGLAVEVANPEQIAQQRSNPAPPPPPPAARSGWNEPQSRFLNRPLIRRRY